MTEIYKLLPKVVAEIGSIGKDNRNQQQNYNFRGIDDALNHCSPILARHGVTVSVNVKDRQMHRVQRAGRNGEQTVTHCDLLMEVTFSAPDGSAVTNTLAGEGMDFGGDKATNKAMSAAMKYGLFFGLVIPVDADSVDDSDRDPKPEPTPKKPAKPATPPGYNDVIKSLKEMGCKTAEDYAAAVSFVTEGSLTDPAVLKTDAAAVSSLKLAITQKAKKHGGLDKIMSTRVEAPTQSF